MTIFGETSHTECEMSGQVYNTGAKRWESELIAIVISLNLKHHQLIYMMLVSGNTH